MGLKYTAESLNVAPLIASPSYQLQGQNKINFDYVRYCQSNMPCIFFTLYHQAYRYGDSKNLLRWEVIYRYLIKF